MIKQFNPSRLKLARTRRQLTFKSLAEKVGLTPRMVSEYEKNYCEHIPPEQTINAFSNALGYPESFFFISDDVEEISPDTVSFRSLKSMKAAEQHAAIGAGSIALLINNYFESNFNLPSVNVPDLRELNPEAAAETIRELWKLGSQSINNMIHLLELHGVRVFSLAENTQSVDAFSFWKDGIPYVFLNTKKSGERSRFDAAHELGHLILHRHGIPQGKDIEAEADQFAAHLLMPKKTVLAHSGRYISLEDIIRLKHNWKVSAMALIVHMKNIDGITEWHHRNLIIEASRKGLRTKEINGIEREKSLLIDKLLSSLKQEGTSIKDIANYLSLPLEELTNLLFKVGVIFGSEKPTSKGKRPTLKLVK